MDERIRLSPEQALELALNALTGAGANPENVSGLAEAIVDTELSGLEGHGFYWLQYYCEHTESGKVDGRVCPGVEKLSPAAFRIDARNGFAHPAIEAGIERIAPAARKYGIAAFGVYNSYNAATLGYHTGLLARAGLLAMGFTNSIPAIAPFGGRTPVIGTNPFSVAVPGEAGEIALLIDQSSSAVAWTAVKRAAEENRPIPEGWALDADGRPTTDPEKGLAGSMAPFGGYKGFNQGLMVEIFCAALAGGRLGPDMGSFTENDGQPIGNGQFFIALDPKIFSGGLFAGRLRELCESIESQQGVRLPNARRLETQARLSVEGIPVEGELYQRLVGFTQNT